MYLLFAGHMKYPEGGSGDFRGKFGSIEDAQEWVRGNKKVICHMSYIDLWADILDADTIESVSFGCIDESMVNKNFWFEEWHSSRNEFWIHN